MSKYKTAISKETVKESESIAKATQRPGQTKEQTKLIALGIQKGIEQYKKQHKVKARELNKKLKTVKSIVQTNSTNSEIDRAEIAGEQKKSATSPLPWLLLVVSWISFSLFWYMNH